MELQKVEQVKLSYSIPYWIKVVIVFFLGWVFMYADRAILNPVMGNIKSEFGLTNSQVGLINSVFFLTYAATQIPFGILGDKFSRKMVLVPGFVLFGILTWITGTVTSLVAFLLAAAVVGIGQGAYYGPQFALSSEVIPKKYRSLGSALINSGGAFGISLGYIASSSLTLAWGYSWRTSFYLFAVPTVLVGLFIWKVIKEERKDWPKVHRQKSSANTGITLASLFKNRNLIVSYIVVFCSLYGFFVILTWLPYYLQTERGLQGSQVGFISSLTAWAAIPGAILFSTISDKLGRRKPLVFILLPCAALSICAIAYIQDFSLLIVFLLCYGLTGKIALDPVLVAFVADNAPKQGYSTAFGVFNFSGMCSSILAPYITGYLADKTGSMAAGFYLAAALLLVGCVVMTFAQEGKKAEAEAV
ncbi:MFS transporter [Fodinisporobacter ferrooxydans]|uniref:MFS transporter n=1 Tax=Fodinisporobacter ferrooxydans TaxID=2901836 RepID=A0ABY4CPE3_9BACL|nr:MFS transporter [Alicyclobacillaceae bacterium MYW30-H2]